MKKLLLAGGLLLAVALAIVGWFLCAPFFFPHRVEVKDVRRAENLVLGEKIGNTTTYGLDIRGSGEVDGEATISLLLHGEPYKVAKVSGNIDFQWRGDWYSETAEVRYEPVNVQSGKVVLRYRFDQ